MRNGLILGSKWNTSQYGIVPVIVLAQIKEPVMSQMELVFVIQDFKEILVKVNFFFSYEM